MGLGAAFLTGGSGLAVEELHVARRVLDANGDSVTFWYK